MIATRRLLLPVALVLVGAASARLFAEDLDPLKLFDSAKASCQEKRYGKCLADLQLLVGEVGRLRTDSMKPLLPKPPEGWTADEAEAASNGGAFMFGAGSQVKREYKSGDSKTCRMTLSTDVGAIMSGWTMLLSNPAFLGEGKRIVTIKGRKGLLDWEKGADHGSLMLQLGVPASMIQLEASGVTDKEIQDVLAGALDLDAIEKALTN